MGASGATFDIANAANTFTIGIPLTGSAITKVGTGTLTLANTVALTGNLATTQGALNLTGVVTGSNTASSLVLNAPTVGIPVTVNVSSGTQATPNLFFGMTGANTAGTVSVYNQTAGYVLIAPSTAQTTNQFTANTGYGYFNLTGGTYKDGSATATSRFNLATNAVSQPGVGVNYVGGALSGGAFTGTALLDQTNGEWMLNYGTASLTLTPGGTINRTGASQLFGLTMNSIPVNGAFTEWNQRLLRVVQRGRRLLYYDRPQPGLREWHDFELDRILEPGGRQLQYRRRHHGQQWHHRGVK